ncbi:MAG TPA: hypothetical protein VHG09_14790 [Longimicrobiales bacterium]|nr:hypothetical protein [Longimicrobiales bacterium]
MRRFTIMGFTEAELGFVLAALFIALAVTAIDEQEGSAADVDRQEQIADSIAAEAAAMRDSVALLRKNFAVLRDSVQVLEDRISTKVPQCWEKGQQSAPIANVAVLGANRFEMNGEAVTIDGIRQRLASFIAIADSLDCRFVVRARPTSGIDAVQQSAAVWQLRRYFDVNDRPQ